MESQWCAFPDIARDWNSRAVHVEFIRNLRWVPKPESSACKSRAWACRCHILLLLGCRCAELQLLCVLSTQVQVCLTIGSVGTGICSRVQLWQFVVPVTNAMAVLSATVRSHLTGKDMEWKPHGSWHWFPSSEWEEWKFIRLQARLRAFNKSAENTQQATQLMKVFWHSSLFRCCALKFHQCYSKCAFRLCVTALMASWCRGSRDFFTPHAVLFFFLPYPFSILFASSSLQPRVLPLLLLLNVHEATASLGIKFCCWHP